MATDDFARFSRAQDPVWSTILAELRLGRKRSHWMWFVFPQLAALGRSETAKFFGLDGAVHARSYLAHPVLGPRLEEVTGLVLGHRGTSADDIFGALDAQKLRSSMTLFEAAAADGAPFAQVIEAFYSGERCPLTEAILAK